MKTEKERQATYYDTNARNLDILEEGDVFRMKPLQIGGDNVWKRAIVNRRLDQRSYEVESAEGLYRRNRRHLKKTDESPPPLYNAIAAPHINKDTHKADKTEVIPESAESPEPDTTSDDSDKTEQHTEPQHIESTGTSRYFRKIKPIKRYDSEF